MSKKPEWKVEMERKIFNVKEGIKWKKIQATDWCKNHEKEIAVFGPMILLSSMDLLKSVLKNSTVKTEKAFRDRYIYDCELGHYYELNRKPRPSEWRIIDLRINQKQSVGFILEDMGLIKK